MNIKNVEIFGLDRSKTRSGYPMTAGDVEDLDTLGYAENRIERDNKRASKLASVKVGTGHDNFLKGIIVQFDLRYPEYFSPQLQRYSWIDIISSQSKMHRITSRELTQADFSDRVFPEAVRLINRLVKSYNRMSKSPDIQEGIFLSIVANLPSGYMKWMGISTNYLQLKTIYNQRKNHKLPEWRYFCKWIETLPDSELITKKIKKNE